MIALQDLHFLVTLATSPSFAIAARRLDVSAPHVTQKLKRLEASLGVSLFERGRQPRLTPQGRLITERGGEVLRQMRALEESLQSSREELGGQLNIVAPIGFGEKRLAPLLGEYRRQHPHVTLDLTLSDRPAWEGNPRQPDIMFYIGELHQSPLYRTLIAPTRRLLCAAPAYLASMPPLHRPEDLAHHHCIVLRENDEDCTLWRLRHLASGEESSIRVSPSLTSNVADAVKQWALQGLGIIHRSEWDLQPELAAGTLVPVLPDYAPPAVDIVALMGSSRENRPRRINHFLTFVQERLREELGGAKARP